ncbi:DUF3152 domain-containing protein, partial [Streptomyces sp. T-3]|nr:DUF3152 domain-containing protein [Streptomyces sp. T-3]
GTPAHGMPHVRPDGTPAHGSPQVRGGHPEQREGGGGWGVAGGAPAPAPGRPGYGAARVPGPRRDFVEAFDGLDDDDDVFAVRTPQGRTQDPYGAVTDWDRRLDDDDELRSYDREPEPVAPEKAKGGKGRTFTGIAAAAVTTVLAVVVAGQVADGRPGGTQTQAADADGKVRDNSSEASRSQERPAPAKAAETYDQKMDKKYPLAADLKGSGDFEVIGGFDKAPGPGQKFRYRVDVEKGIGLDGELFAQAVQKTLNDDRSWAHGGQRSFERISSGKPDFVITLASPGTTGTWCAKSGLDTTEDNVSCDSAATDRVMINAFRWAQGAKTYGDHIHPYRQMLINHEVGHRLGYNHVQCSADGALAPVMQQQTKFLEHDGISCKANPWAFPKS